MNYEIGDKVKFIGKNRMNGRKGTIIEDGGRNWYRVKFETNRYMWCTEEELELLPNDEPLEMKAKSKLNKEKYDLRKLKIKTDRAFCSITLDDVFSSTHTSCEKCIKDLVEWLEK